MARSNILIANQVVTGAGNDAASRPSISFGDSDSGFYETTDDKISVSLAGTERFHFSGSEFTKADGTKYITSAVVGANEVGNNEISGQIRWAKLANGTQGQVLYVNSQSQISGLAVGTLGQRLTTQGAGADPIWETPSAGNASGMTMQSIKLQVGTASGQAYVEIPAGHAGRMVHTIWAAKGSGGNTIDLRYRINQIDTTFNLATLGTETHGEVILHQAPSGSGTNTTIWGRYQTTTGAITTFGGTNVDHAILNPMAQAITFTLGLGANMSGQAAIMYL